MGGDFKLVNLGSIANVRSGFAFKSCDMGSVGLPVIKIKNVTPPTVDITDCERVPDSVIAAIPRVERFAILPGDILIAMTGATVGKVGRFPLTRERFFLNQRVGKVYLTDPDKADYRFLYYILSQDTYVNQMFGTADGSAQANISGAQIERLEITVPPLPEQRAIAHILGTLDDKIELNRRMNETLEAMARALFKSWFVDFDPVRAKAEGRDPGLPQHLADLFPDSFEDSELGEIPREWGVGSILDHARLLSGGTPKTDRPEYWGGRISWASAKDISQSTEIFLIETERDITQEGVNKSATQIIPELCSVVVARGATTGRMVLFGRAMAMNQTCYALMTTTETPFALYCRLNEEMNKLVHGAHGSVFDTITTKTFESALTVLPATAAMKAFEQRVAPLFHRVLLNVSEARTLASLRDTLLPKLISGELRIKDDERFVERAL